MRTIRSPRHAAWKCSALILALFAIARGAPDQPARHPLFLEAYPENIQNSLDARDRLLGGQSFLVKREKRSVSPQFVIKWIRRWMPGSTITVAFSGGSPELRS